MKKPTENIKDLGLDIPKAQNPLGAYVPFKVTGNLIYISGQISIDKNGNLKKGKVGKDLTVDDAQIAAKLCALNIISQVREACDGDLDKVKNCIKINGYINSSENFIDQPKVLNTASEIITKVFNDSGKHARAAVGVSSLPLDSAVEIDAIFEIFE